MIYYITQELLCKCFTSLSHIRRISGLFIANACGLIGMYWVKCKQTQVKQLYVHIFFCLMVIRPWLNLPTSGHGHVICMGNLGGVFSQENTPVGHTETHKSSSFPFKQVSGRNGDHEWLRMTNAFILWDLLWKAQQNHAANREGSFNYNNLDKKVRHLKALIQKKLRSEYWKYIESIIIPDDSKDEQQQYKSMKWFWRFIKSKAKDFIPVGPLTKDVQTANAPGEKPTTDNPVEKANILNRKFETVFTWELPISPDLLPQDSPYKSMNDIAMEENGVRKLLETINPHKAAGPDEITARILKEIASSIAPILTAIYQVSYDRW